MKKMIYVTKSRRGVWNNSELPSEEEKTLMVASKRARELCNSEVKLIPPYRTGTRTLATGETMLSVFASYKCGGN